MASALPCGDQQLRTEVSNNAASINLCNAHICNSTWRASHGLLHAGTVRLFSFAVSHAWHSGGGLLVALMFWQLPLRVLCLAKESAWLPWLDIGQLVLIGVLFR